MGYFDAYADGYGLPPTAGPGAAVTVDWSPTTNPLDTPTWVNIPGVRGVTTSRGRRSEVDQIQAGTASILVDNRDRRFDPLYTAGANYPNVLPMKRVRIQATYNSVTYDLFQGFVDSWDQAYSNPNDGTVELRLVDFFEVLNGAIFSPSPYQLEVRADQPRLWFPLGEQAGATSVTDVIAGVVGVVQGGTFGVVGLVANQSDSALSLPGGSGAGITVSQEVAQTYLSAAAEAAVELLVNVHTLPAAGTTATLWEGVSNISGATEGALTLDDAGFLGLYSHAGGGLTASSPLVVGSTYHVVAMFAGGGPTRSTIWINGVKVADSGLGGGLIDPGPILIGRNDFGSGVPNAVIDEFAIYTVALSSTRIAAHAAAALTPWVGDTTGQRIGRALDYVGVAAGDRDVDTTTTTLQAANILNQSLLDHMQAVNQLEQGLLFVTKDGTVRFRGRTGGFNLASSATFGDGPGELPYSDISFDYSKQLIANVVRRQNQGGLLMEASDQASIDAYGRRVDSKTGLIGDNDLVSFDLANYRLSKAKDPVVRVTEMTVSPERAPATLYPQVLGREIGEQLTIKRRPQGVGTAMFDARIEGVSHTISPEAWTAKFLLSPADTGAYWQLDAVSGPGLDSFKLAY